MLRGKGSGSVSIWSVTRVLWSYAVFSGAVVQQLLRRGDVTAEQVFGTLFGLAPVLGVQQQPRKRGGDRRKKPCAGGVKVGDGIPGLSRGVARDKRPELKNVE